MGCGSCVNENQHKQGTNNAKISFNSIINQKIEILKPCKLVDEALLLRVIKHIKNYIYNFNEKGLVTQASLANQEYQKSNNEIINIWKTLVFCSGLDLYEDHIGINTFMKHKCFQDIEKDVDRTFPQIKQFQTQQMRMNFKETLQKLSLYFPKLGYTQGINFIVGYIFYQGFNKDDVFWMTVHLFLKQQFLFLGFFEQQFPLSEIYCTFFKYLLKKHCKLLSNHFDRLNLNNKMWIFKWFITVYLYSLPLQTIQKIWSYILIVGGLGIVYFALSLVKSLQFKLGMFNDELDIIQFFVSLKDKQVFNSLVDLQEVITNALDYQLSDKQIQQLAQSTKFNLGNENNFYKKYYSNYGNLNLRKQLLQKWYTEKKDDRLQFAKQKSKRSSFVNVRQIVRSGFRVKKQSQEIELVKLPKIIQQQQQTNIIKLKPKINTQNIMERIKVVQVYGDSEQKQLGQYVHKISFKKKKNLQNQDIKQKLPTLKYQMSQKVLPKKTAPRIKRKCQKEGNASNKSNISSIKSDALSFIQPQLMVHSSGYLQQQIQNIYYIQQSQPSIDIKSVK